MDTEADLIAVLNDLVQFLEGLGDVKLPSDLENTRETLIRRSKCSLTAVKSGLTSPEPYLDMNAGKGRRLLFMEAADVINDNHITEYIDANQVPAKRVSLPQDYYETFLETSTCLQAQNPDYDDGEAARIIYRRFSAEDTLSKCIKSGALFQKEERRLFGFPFFGGFDQFRSCWIGIVGSHLLVYASKNDKQPSDVICIRGYSARPAPNAIPRDVIRGKSAFEIFCPGNRTFLFLAKYPKEMEQWIAAICRAGKAVSSVKRDSAFISTVDGYSDEPYQDASHLVGENLPKEIASPDRRQNNGIHLRNSGKKLSNPPPLPARIPRRLPSLPCEDASVQPSPSDEYYDADDIYHKIEDLRESVNNYQNVSKCNNNMKNKVTALEIYDDVLDVQKGDKKNTAKGKKKISKDNSSPVEFYDDIQAGISKREKSPRESSLLMYDDIEAIESKTKFSESPRKKTFLERVRYKKESPKKIEVKKKSKQMRSMVKDVQESSNQELPTYDDICNLASNLTVDDIADYNCPPVPRPVYIKSLVGEEVYDDIGVAAVENIAVNQVGYQAEPSLAHQVSADVEHYQVPKLQDPMTSAEKIVEEELYDDIAILEDFRAKQRDCSSSSVENSTTSMKKTWNLFSTKTKISDQLIITEKNHAETNGDECSNNLSELCEENHLKVNKFQKLINKVDSSINKSTRNASSVINNKYLDDTK